ncbi:MAG TPA: MerR family transcriptional regulator [Steroidobacteraceae bacterium]|jgi:DNA-binding transcriptional MerR regulator
MVRAAAARDGLTVSALARQFGLSRSTLLHYHRIQLCRPTGRSAAGYRVYGPDAVARLARIVELRTAGLALRTIKRVLDAQTPLAEVLEEQIGVLNRQLAGLRAQQRVVLSLLELSSRTRQRTLSKENWTDMFRAIGMSDAEMQQWHANFEKHMPDAHADFLHSLGLGEEEIRRIRAWSVA